MKPTHGKRLLTKADEQLLDLLDRSPELRQRIESIVALTKAEEGELRRADMVEELLVEEVRRLGGEVMREWAVRAEERVAREVQAAHPKASVRKKSS
ncbi:MAG TPA: hypothetical protein VGF01_01695 [Terracidiphilus sp.]|jgi:hypothetical protein